VVDGCAPLEAVNRRSMTSCLVASISLYRSNDGWTFQRHSTRQLIPDLTRLRRLELFDLFTQFQRWSMSSSI